MVKITSGEISNNENRKLKNLSLRGLALQLLKNFTISNSLKPGDQNIERLK